MLGHVWTGRSPPSNTVALSNIRGGAYCPSPGSRRRRQPKQPKSADWIILSVSCRRERRPLPASRDREITLAPAPKANPIKCVGFRLPLPKSSCGAGSRVGLFKLGEATKSQTRSGPPKSVVQMSCSSLYGYWQDIVHCARSNSRRLDALLAWEAGESAGH